MPWRRRLLFAGAVAHQHAWRGARPRTGRDRGGASDLPILEGDTGEYRRRARADRLGGGWRRRAGAVRPMEGVFQAMELLPTGPMAPFLNLIYSDERSKEAFACLSAFRRAGALHATAGSMASSPR